MQRGVKEKPMSKISESQRQSEIPDDSEMLDEYDFSKGVRGKYYRRFQKAQEPALLSTWRKLQRVWRNWKQK